MGVQEKNGSWKNKVEGDGKFSSTKTVKEICENTCGQDFCKYWVSTIDFSNRKGGKINDVTKLAGLGWTGESFHFTLHFYENEDDYESWKEFYGDSMTEIRLEEGDQKQQRRN